jgi:hypothetical protein
MKIVSVMCVVFLCALSACSGPFLGGLKEPELIVSLSSGAAHGQVGYSRHTDIYGGFFAGGPPAFDVDDSGRIYVADAFNTRVQVFGRKGNFLYSFSTSDNSAATYTGHNIVCRRGRVYVTDVDIGGNNTAVYDTKGKLLRTFGRQGQGVGEYMWAVCVDADSKGNFYALGIQAGKIIQYGAAGNYIKDIDGSAFFSVDKKDKIYTSIPPEYKEIAVRSPSSELYQVERLIRLPFTGAPERVDKKGNIYFTEDQGITALSADGAVLYNLTVPNMRQRGGSMTKNCVIDQNGNIYVAETVDGESGFRMNIYKYSGAR